MGKGYIARGHRPTASGRSYESIDPKSTRRHGRSISAGSPGRVGAKGSRCSLLPGVSAYVCWLLAMAMAGPNNSFSHQSHVALGP
jgi:hypothetical protein